MVKYCIVVHLPCTAEEYMILKDDPEYVRYQLGEVGARELSRVSELGADGFVTQTIVNRPNIAVPRVLRPLLRGVEPTDWRNSIFYAYYNRSPKHWGIRTDRYKLIRFPDTETIEFYDLQEDPAEMYNRAAEPAYKKQIATTQKQLDTLMTNTGVTREFLLKKMGDNTKLPPRIHKKRKK